MAAFIDVKWDRAKFAAFQTGIKGAVKRALRKAGATGLRDMGSEASKRIRTRKRISPKYIRDAMTLKRPSGNTLEWRLNFSGKPVPLIAYPHRQTKKGVTVEVNRGKRTLVKSAFEATMGSGHLGIFKRKGKARLPIKELRGSRPVDALLHQGEADAVAARGGKSFAETFARLLPMEIGK